MEEEKLGKIFVDGKMYDLDNMSSEELEKLRKEVKEQMEKVREEIEEKLEEYDGEENEFEI